MAGLNIKVGDIQNQTRGKCDFSFMIITGKLISRIPKLRVRIRARFKLGSEPGFELGSEPGFELGSEPGFELGSEPEFEPGFEPGFELGTESGFQPRYGELSLLF